MKRRTFLEGASGIAIIPSTLTARADLQGLKAGDVDAERAAPVREAGLGFAAGAEATHDFNGSYTGAALNHVAFPMGGMGAGMICLEGTGALSKFSLQNRPDLLAQRNVFAAVSIKGRRRISRVLEGPVPSWECRPGAPGSEAAMIPTSCWGLPRYRRATFEARFPFATVRLSDDEMPLDVELTGWSPFSPGDADNASLPVAALEYLLTNRGQTSVEAVFSFNAENFLAKPPDPSRQGAALDRVRQTPGGFMLYGPGAPSQPWDETWCAAWTDDPQAKVNHVWFRGGEWNDAMRMVWNDVESAACYARDPLSDSSSPGATLFVPFALAPGATKSIAVRLAWYVPKSNLFQPTEVFRDGKFFPAETPSETYAPWYSGRFSGIDEVVRYWQSHYLQLRADTARFSYSFFDSTLPAEVLEAVAANLSILKSPTVLRQVDGRLWGWEGVNDMSGNCYGSATHVWNYAQTVAHLFPALERTLRETELESNQDENGHQYCRAALPIRPIAEGHQFPDAVDGQLGGIIKIYREWRICGDTAWLRRWWPIVRASLEYCIKTWDPDNLGWLMEPQGGTYDAELWGPNSMCTSLYLGALKAACLMGETLDEPIERYRQLFSAGVQRMETELFNGEYFSQRTQWKGLRTPFPHRDIFSPELQKFPEELAIANREGPKYQYGGGCLSNGLVGAWLSLVCGLEEFLDGAKVRSHLLAVHRFNFKPSLIDHVNLMRSVLGSDEDSGLIVCSWPRGGRPTLPLIYADEVFTGVEYEVASYLIMIGQIEEGLQIVRAARRRYDGRVRNPFAEIEAGQWYARAMSSYALLQAFSGARFDAVEKVVHLSPAVSGNFRCFLSTATGYGTVGVADGTPFLKVVAGEIPYRRIQYTAAPA